MCLRRSLRSILCIKRLWVWGRGSAPAATAASSSGQLPGASSPRPQIAGAPPPAPPPGLIGPCAIKQDLCEALLCCCHPSSLCNPRRPWQGCQSGIKGILSGLPVMDPDLPWCEVLIVLVSLTLYPSLWALGSRPRPGLALHSRSWPAQSQC